MISIPGVDLFMARIAKTAGHAGDAGSHGTAADQTASRILPGDRLDVLAYGCVASVVLGADRVSERLAEAKPDTPTSNPITAAFAAFDALGARHIGADPTAAM